MERVKKYVYKIYQTQSFSEAAKELYISQPSLSATIKKLETELGFSIFNRSKTPVGLTPEGEIYIEYLEETMKNEQNMRYRIRSLSTLSDEKLYLGGTNILSRRLLPKACGEFHRRFPDVEVKVDLGEVGNERNLFDKLVNGELELIITHRCDESKFSYVPLFEERYIIAMRRDFSGADKLLPFALTRDEILSGREFPEREISDYNMFRNIRFLRFSKNGSVRQHLADFFEQCEFSQCYVCNSRGFDIHYEMMLEGMGAVVTAESVVAVHPEKSDEVNYFLIKSNHNVRCAMIIYKRGKELSKSAKEFIAITQKLCQSKNEIFPNIEKHSK